MGWMAASFYEVLGVEPSATPDEIRAAYRQKAKELHPDLNPARDTHAEMAQVNAAFETLSSPALRTEYDRTRVGLGTESRRSEPSNSASPPTGRSYSESWRESYLTEHRREALDRARRRDAAFDRELWRTLYRRAVELQRQAAVRFEPHVAEARAWIWYAEIRRAEEVGETKHVNGYGQVVPVTELKVVDLEPEIARLTDLIASSEARATRSGRPISHRILGSSRGDRQARDLARYRRRLEALLASRHPN